MEPLKPLKDMAHLTRCFGQLTVMYAQERLRAFADMVDDAMDIDFGDLED